MKKTLTMLMAAYSMAGLVYAGGDIGAPVEPNISVPEVAESVDEGHESDFYVVAKALTIAGDKVNHGDAVLDGDRGYGVGLDLGYRIGNGFAIETDFSYAKNDVTEFKTGFLPETFSAKYTTAALVLVYTYELTEALGVFGKLGYEYEREKISGLGIDDEGHDFVYAGGFEYMLDESYKAVVEYEHSAIEGPKGDTISLGVMYNF
jgi:opacity protein-like surface antigen